MKAPWALKIEGFKDSSWSELVIVPRSHWVVDDYDEVRKAILDGLCQSTSLWLNDTWINVDHFNAIRVRPMITL